MTTTRPTSPDPPPGPTEFATGDPERAHAFLRTTYVDHTIRIRGSQDGFLMRHTQYDTGEFAVGTLEHTMAIEHHVEPLGYLLVGRLLEGRLERETADGALRLSQDDMFVFASPDEPYVVRWEDVKLQLIRVNLGALVRLGEAAPASTPRFTDLRPLSPDRARQLTGTLNWLTDDLLANPEAVAQPLIVGAAARILAGTVLRTFPNGAAAEPVAPHDSDARPAVLRRAMAFIEANAETDVSLGDVAAAARVTPRTVQHAFRRHLETTPGAYLRRVRLDRAHRDLVAADPGRGDTVNAIMVRWGFANPGRFATAYRATYGQSPRDTLTA